MPFLYVFKMKIKHIFSAVLLATLSTMGFAQGCLEPAAGSSNGPKIIGYLQPQYEYHFTEDSKTRAVNTNTFKFNRMRIGVAGSIPYDFEYYALVEFSSFFTGNPFMLDAFVSYTRLGHWAKFSAGSFKSPVSLELTTPCNGLNTINRSMVVDELTSPNRDLGVGLYGSTDTLTIFGIETVNLLKYSFAITNGTGLGVIDNNGGKNYSGRVVLTPWKHLSLGASYLTGKQKPAAEGVTDEDTKTRWGVDADFNWGAFRLQGEYLFGEDKGSYTEGGGCGTTPVVKIGNKQRDGFYVTAMYMTPWNIQPVFKYEQYDKDLDTDGDKQNIMTFGLNYFLNDWTRLQVNYLYKAEETAAIEYPNDCLLVQIQVKLK
jgi:phosphate-selective porin